jgi:AcrR family transcriptional regulator
MAQVLKEETRTVILESALSLFARKGFRDTSLIEVAEASGISAGNVYRYFPDKKALYEAAVPAGLIDRLSSVLDKKIAALAGIPLSSMEEGRTRFKKDLIDLLMENRLHWIILLRENGDTLLVERLVSFWLRWIRTLALPPGTLAALVTEEKKKAIHLYYANLSRLMTDHLLEFTANDGLERLLGNCLDYHLGGLDSLLAAWTAL